MSNVPDWKFTGTGHKGAVIRTLDRASFGDNKFAGIAQRTVAQMIEELPTDGVILTMSGYADGNTTIELRGVDLILDDREESQR